MGDFVRVLIRLCLAVVGVIALPVAVVGLFRIPETPAIAMAGGGIAIIAAVLWIDARIVARAEKRRSSEAAIRSAEVVQLIDSGGEWSVEGSSYATLSLLLLLATAAAWWFAIAVEAAAPVLLLAVLLSPASAAMGLLFLSRRGLPMLRVTRRNLDLAGFGPIDWSVIRNLYVQDIKVKGTTQWVLQINLTDFDVIRPQVHWATRLFQRMHLGGAKHRIHFSLKGSSEDALVVKEILERYWRQSGGQERALRMAMPKEMELFDKVKSLSARMDNQENIDLLLPELAEIETELKRRTGELQRAERPPKEASPPVVPIEDLIAKRLPPDQFRAALEARIKNKIRFEIGFWLALFCTTLAVTGVLISAPFDRVAAALPLLHNLFSFPAKVVPFTAALASGGNAPSAIGLALGVAIWAVPLQVWLIRNHATMLISWNSRAEKWTARVMCAFLLLLFIVIACNATIAAGGSSELPSAGATLFRVFLCVAASVSTVMFSALLVTNYSLWVRGQINR